MALVPVCDICEERDGVEAYELKGGGRSSNVDLCKIHAKPVQDIMSKGRVTETAATPVRRPTKRAASKSRGKQVTSIEEIEALKKSS